jgi:hypothetical protein
MHSRFKKHFVPKPLPPIETLGIFHDHLLLHPGLTLKEQNRSIGLQKEGGSLELRGQYGFYGLFCPDKPMGILFFQNPIKGIPLKTFPSKIRKEVGRYPGVFQRKRLFPHETAPQKVENPGIFRGQVKTFSNPSGGLFASEINNLCSKGKPHIPKVFRKTRYFGESTGRLGRGHKGSLSLFPIEHPLIYQSADGFSGGHTADAELFAEFPLRRDHLPCLIDSVIHQSKEFFFKLVIKRQGALTLELLHGSNPFLVCCCYVVYTT